MTSVCTIRTTTQLGHLTLSGGKDKVTKSNYHWRDNFFLWYLCTGADIAINAINKEEQGTLVSQLNGYHKLNQLQAKQLWRPAYYEKYNATQLGTNCIKRI